MQTLKTWLTRLALIAGSLLFTVVLIEISLRLFPGLLPPGFGVEASRTVEVNPNEFGFYQFDPTIGWVGVPNAEGTLVTTESETAVHFNSAGLRDDEYTLEKPEGVTRIAVLGDSFTWGYGVEQDENFAAVLEQRFAIEGQPVEVINFGLTGYGTDQSYLIYQEIAHAYDPDIVILAFYENDVLEVANERMYGYPKPYYRLDEAGQLTLTNIPLPEPDDWLATREHGLSPLGVPGTLKNRLYSTFQTIHLVRFLLGKLRVATESKDIYNQDAEVWSRMQALITALHDDVTADGAELVILYIPTRWEILRTAPWAFEFDRMTDFLTADLPGVTIIDPRDALRASPDVPPAGLYFEFNGGHWAAPGHALVGNLLYDRLLDEGLLE